MTRWQKALKQSRRIGKTKTRQGKRQSVHRWAELTKEALR